MLSLIKRVVALAAVLALVVVGFSACTPALVGEKAAKEAGLMLINHVFDAEETDAEVVLEQRPGLSYINGIQAHLGDEPPIYYYTIRVDIQEDGNPRYYAEVNAVTGVAYRAERSLSTIVLTREQQNQADALGTLDDFGSTSFSQVQQDGMQRIEEWVRAGSADVPYLRTVTNNIESDSVDFPLVRMDYYAVFLNGDIDNVEICWPTMEVVGLYILNQDN